MSLSFTVDFQFRPEWLDQYVENICKFHRYFLYGLSQNTTHDELSKQSLYENFINLIKFLAQWYKRNDLNKTNINYNNERWSTVYWKGIHTLTILLQYRYIVDSATDELIVNNLTSRGFVRFLMTLDAALICNICTQHYRSLREKIIFRQWMTQICEGNYISPVIEMHQYINKNHVYGGQNNKLVYSYFHFLQDYHYFAIEDSTRVNNLQKKVGRYIMKHYLFVDENTLSLLIVLYMHLILDNDDFKEKKFNLDFMFLYNGLITLPPSSIKIINKQTNLLNNDELIFWKNNIQNRIEKILINFNKLDDIFWQNNEMYNSLKQLYLDSIKKLKLIK